MKDIERVEQFLKDVPVVYLTTVTEGKPKCRPIGLHMLIGDTLYFGVGTFKDVYRQMEANPFVEFCVCKDRVFLRYYGKAVFEKDYKIANAAISAAPFLQQVYNETTGKKLGMFHLENATAEFRTMTGIRESLTL
ncbi:pyridoxamine 5'-phosphate oxidase family protein [Intestinimonas massiliensis (ex Afouda et al. 2020)]|uniref:pyridoxamine 5'-phosphate oxidase family protein n=1 Tax=Intestinimonas massiliensis (ex Afouda et al. 2020) TaxID=1673721 RepID=UPI0010304F56|nr:pyridoxamine 5'-phosphate oxidase family protein [Intestinimonas massiliensis (ex Afouda et al. 2020)]